MRSVRFVLLSSLRVQRTASCKLIIVATSTMRSACTNGWDIRLNVPWIELKYSLLMGMMTGDALFTYFENIIIIGRVAWSRSCSGWFPSPPKETKDKISMHKSCSSPSCRTAERICWAPLRLRTVHFSLRPSCICPWNSWSSSHFVRSTLVSYW